MARTKAAMNEKTPMPRESLIVEDHEIPARDQYKIPVRLYKPRNPISRSSEDLPVVVM